VAKKREEVGVVQQLKDAIRDSGKTLTELAGLSGVDSSRLSRFLRDERDLTGAAIDRICAALGLRLAPARKRGKGKQE
jgi:transcriptional regulator with XRE-family HTH domain